MRHPLTFIVLGASLVGAGACAPNSTQMVATWRDPTVPTVYFNKTLAVFMSKEPGMRRMVEDKLAARIPGGVPSYRVIPDNQLANLDSVRGHVLKEGYDGAVIMKLVGVTTEVNYVPGTSWYTGPRDFYGYWGNSWGYAYDPGYYTTDQLYSVETALYDIKNDKMIWMGRSQTIDPKNANKLADYSVNFAIKNMQKQGLLRN